MLRRSISWYGKEYPIIIPLPIKQNKDIYIKLLLFLGIFVIFIKFLYLY